MTNLETELLAALIQMENWASLYRAEIRRLCGQEPGPLELASQEIREARAVIAKAKEQSNA